MTTSSTAAPRRRHALGVRPSAALVVASAWALATSRPAHAGDALRERTPVIHLGESCLTVIDRAATPVIHLDYTLPFEDRCSGPHPPPSSHFFALCRPLVHGEALPQWITRADIAAAESLGFALPTLGAESVLEESPTWSGCWARINADDDRRPLTCDEALAGIEWDVSATAPGVYAVVAYTFYPPLNLWAPRWGIFAIHDGDPGSIDPVAAIANRAGFVYADEVMTLEVCTSALAGSTLTVEYAIDGATPAWSIAVEGVAVEGSKVSASWDPPAEVETSNMRLRATITDPLGRARTLESPEVQAMLGVPSPTTGDVDPPPPLHDTCRDDAEPAQAVCGKSSTSTSTSTGDADPTGDAPSDPSSGCACAVDDVDPSVALFASILCLTLGAGRRRRSPIHGRRGAGAPPRGSASDPRSH
ncbi:MAG: hypothetical protein R3B09_05150 [Nannocystaceae bacterium]